MSFDYQGYAERKLGDIEVNSTGQVVARCPFCDKSRKFYMDKRTGHYLCFSCEERGRGMVGVVAKLEGITHKQAKQFIKNDETSLARELTLGEMLSKLRPKEEEPEEFKVNISLPDGFTPVYADGKWRHPAYLKNRGIPREVAHKYRLGFINDGYYAGRIVIPIDCPNGHSFTARDATNKNPRRYLNPKAAGHGKLVFGWDQCQFDRGVILVEGAFDAINMHMHGFQSLGLLGKVLHVEQRNMFWALPSDLRITIMLDAGEVSASMKVAGILSERFDKIYVAQLGDGMDPGDATYDQALSALVGAERYSPLGSVKSRLKNIKKAIDS